MLSIFFLVNLTIFLKAFLHTFSFANMRNMVVSCSSVDFLCPSFILISALDPRLKKSLTGLSDAHTCWVLKVTSHESGVHVNAWLPQDRPIRHSKRLRQSAWIHQA